MKNKFLILISGLFILFFSLESCRKERLFNEDPNFRLTFSTDTVCFDTIFTSLTSTTAMMKVYNPSNKDIKISNIRLEDGNAFFGINVSGDNSGNINNFIIRAKDSIFIFVNIKIDPSDEAAPVEITGKIVFDLAIQGRQEVTLLAWGQNAIFHIPDKIMAIPYDNNGEPDTLYVPYSLADCSAEWQDDKPHVIFGTLVVAEGDQLRLGAGTRMNFSSGSALWVLEGGSLIVNGMLGQEVIFEGLRTDADYKNTYGQWDRIWLSAGSLDNEINYAIIRNGKIGLLVDTVVNQNPTLTIQNSIIHNMQTHGILAQGSTIRGKNLQISNCGERLLDLSIGGDYSFEHCSFVNYFDPITGYRKKASLRLNNYYHTASGDIEYRALQRADFTSCIIYGLMSEELNIDLKEDVAGNYKFEYCNVRTQLETNNSALFNRCRINLQPMFKDTSTGDFDIKAYNSERDKEAVIGHGKPNPSIYFDLKGRSRPTTPTIGAYEYYDN